jgi:hypothetical protein
MTIKFLSDSIEFDNFTLNATPTGFRFDGEIAAREFYSLFQGTVAGYGSGGEIVIPTLSTVTTIERFPFSTDTNATTTASLATTIMGAAGLSSDTSGYSAGGYNPAATPLTGQTPIQKFSFITRTNALTIGSLTQARGYVSGHSSATDGFASGGDNLGTVYSNFIDRFPFVNDSSSLYVGGLSTVRRGTAGCNSQENAYAVGGESPSPSILLLSAIDKFSMLGTQSLSTQVSDLITAVRRTSGCSSETNGYSVGGSIGAGDFTNAIQKFPFANESVVTTNAVLTLTLGSSQGTQSSNTHGYSSGGGTGQSPPAPAPGVFTLINTIEKFSFVTDTNATSVGNLSTVGRRSIAGHNY